jgi:two-component system CheB/CheR fusion protein
MLLLEAAYDAGKTFDLKIFATDVASRSITGAREGIFPAAIEDEITPARLRRFFDRAGENYRAKAEIREAIVFAPHDLLVDPPFSRLDLCTCRNLLIYLKQPEQQRVLNLLHFSLREGGVLFLGSSETVGEPAPLFEALDKKHRIFRRTGPARSGALPLTPGYLAAGIRDGGQLLAVSPAEGSPLMREAQRVLVQRFAPGALVLDGRRQIVLRLGKSEGFVHPSANGSRRLFDQVHDDLQSPLRRALREFAAQPAGKARGIAVDVRGRRSVRIRVQPLGGKSALNHILVIFEERGAGSMASNGHASVATLEEELEAVREELRRSLATSQSQGEEMKASHEEAVSMNEELQSTNEELETSKEELQSLNEELTTVNSELQAKMLELEGTTNDLASLLSSTNIAVIFLDPTFRIRRFTSAVHSLVELMPADVGRPLSNFALKFADADLFADARLVLKRKEPIAREVTTVEGRIFVRSVLPYRTPGESVEGVVITFIDLTERKHAEDSLREGAEQHRLMLESLREYVIFTLDEAGLITTWPGAAEATLGYSREDALGRPLRAVLTADDGAEGYAERILAEARQSGSVTNEGWRVRKNGTRFWASGVLSAVRDESGRLRGFVKVLRDHTRQRLADEALHEAKEKAEEANRAKDQFLAMVSHELRTPMSAIVLWANLLGEEPDDPALVQEAVAAIRQGTDEQRELIEDLVDTARIAAGKLRLAVRRTDLIAIAEAAITAIRDTVKGGPMEYVTNFDPAVGVVDADPGRMRQVLSNLLSNATKFSSPGGRIEVGVTRQGNQVQIRVADQGVGFPADFQPHLFSRFRQSARTDGRSRGGLGLGLSIVQQIVALHGGTINGHSPGPGQGATFIVDLPFRLSNAPATGDTKPPFSDTRIKGRLPAARILLVEDTEATVHALTAVLREAGAEVTTASTAAAGLERLGDFGPEILVSDIGLPDMDGNAFIAAIRQREHRLNLVPVPALALTAFAGDNTAATALASGFQSCLAKPIEPIALIEALIKLRR